MPSTSVSPARRRAVYERDGLFCLWCQCPVVPGGPVDADDTATVDHYKAIRFGGRNNLENLFTCCYKCNHRRGSLHASIYAMAMDLYPRLLVIRTQLGKHTLPKITSRMRTLAERAKRAFASQEP